jgi:hypothetical protein
MPFRFGGNQAFEIGSGGRDLHQAIGNHLAEPLFRTHIL